MIKRYKDYFNDFGNMNAKEEWKRLINYYGTEGVRRVYMGSTIAFLNSAEEWRRDDMFGRNMR